MERRVRFVEQNYSDSNLAVHTKFAPHGKDHVARPPRPSIEMIRAAIRRRATAIEGGIE
jgi:hypothetical protein